METKQFGIIDVAVKSVDDPTEAGEWEAILSAPTTDRDGEIIDPKAFEPLPERIPIDIDHDMRVSSTIGSGVPFYDGDVLKMRGTFSSIPRAQEVRTLVTEGHIAKMSVTFMDAKREEDDDGQTHIRRAELLNAAFVPIPSNREASVLAAKGLIKSGARNSSKDAERLQTIHDLAVSNGAVCAEKSSSPPADPEEAGASPDVKSGDAPATPPAEDGAGVIRRERTRLLRAQRDVAAAQVGP